MRGTISDLRPGTVVYRFGEKLHYCDFAEGPAGRLHIFWGWNKFKNRRYYEIFEEWQLQEGWELLRKTKRRRRKINNFDADFEAFKADNPNWDKYLTDNTVFELRSWYDTKHGTYNEDEYSDKACEFSKYVWCDKLGFEW